MSWLADVAVCDFCLGPSGTDFELYCVECDRPACAFCVVRVSGVDRAFHCPECAREATSAASADAEASADPANEGGA